MKDGLFWLTVQKVQNPKSGDLTDPVFDESSRWWNVAEDPHYDLII